MNPSMQATEDSSGSSLRLALLLLPSVLLACGFYCHRIGVDDLWWHLRTGQWIWEQHRVPHADFFSFTVSEKPWINFEWLYQLILYSIYKLGGLAGVTLAHAAGSGIALVLVALAAPKGTTPLARAGAAFVAAAAQFVYPWSRPHVVTQLGVALYLLLLGRDRRITLPFLLLVAAIQAAWTNMHGGYAMGLMMLTFFAIERTLLGVEPGRAWMLAGIAGATSLVNPYGWRLPLHGVAEMRSAYASQYIREWISPLLLQGNPATVVVLVLVGLVLAAACLGLGPERPFLWIVTVAFGFFALRSVRFVTLFALAAVPFLAAAFTRSAARWPVADRDRARRVTPWLIGLGSAAGLWLTLTGRLYALTASDLHPGLGTDTDGTPAGAVAYIERHGLNGPMFHIYDDGSYLIWRLYPRERVLIDPRSALYGDELLARIRAPLDDPRAFHDLDAAWHFQLALIPHTARAYRRIIALLRGNPDWRLVYGDARDCVLVREGSLNALRAPAYEPRDGETIPADFAWIAPDRVPARNRLVALLRQAPDVGAQRHYGYSTLYQVEGIPELQAYHTLQFLLQVPSYHFRYAPMRQWYGEQYAELGLAGR